MDRRKIEEFTASLAVGLLFTTTIGGVLTIADLIFEWDLFPESIDKFLWFILASFIAIIFTTVLVNVMLNLSILAQNSEVLSGKHKDKK